MREAEWLESKDYHALLTNLRGRVSDRKFRLFACACVWHVWHLLADERSRQAVLVAEQFADQQVSEAELVAARDPPKQPRTKPPSRRPGTPRTRPRATTRAIAHDAAWVAAWNARSAGRGTIRPPPCTGLRTPSTRFSETFSEILSAP